MACAVGDRSTQGEIACAAARAHQQVACGVGRASHAQRLDAAGRSNQHQMCCAGEVALHCIAGSSQRGAVSAHLVDIDNAQSADLDAVGFGQEHAASAGADYVGSQLGHVQFEVVGTGACTVASGCAGGDDAQLIGCHVGRVSACDEGIGDAAGAQAHITRGAKAAQLQCGDSHVADVAAAGVGGGSVGHADVSTRAHVYGTRRCADVTIGIKAHGAAAHQTDVTTACIQRCVQCQGACHAEQHVAAASSGDGLAHSGVATSHQYDGTVGGSAQATQGGVGSRRGIECGIVFDAVNQSGTSGHQTDRQCVFFFHKGAAAGDVQSQSADHGV